MTANQIEEAMEPDRESRGGVVSRAKRWIALTFTVVMHSAEVDR